MLGFRKSSVEGKMVVREEVRKMKTVAPLVAATSNEARCKALKIIAE